MPCAATPSSVLSDRSNLPLVSPGWRFQRLASRVCFGEEVNLSKYSNKFLRPSVPWCRRILSPVLSVWGPIIVSPEPNSARSPLVFVEVLLSRLSVGSLLAAGKSAVGFKAPSAHGMPSNVRPAHVSSVRRTSHDDTKAWSLSALERSGAWGCFTGSSRPAPLTTVTPA